MNEKLKAAAKTSERKSDNAVSRKPETTSSPSVNSPIEQILTLQRTIGNQALQRVFKSGALQAKLKVGKPNDIYEQEADRVADQVMTMAEPIVQSKPISLFAKGSLFRDKNIEGELNQTKPITDEITVLIQKQPNEEDLGKQEFEISEAEFERMEERLERIEERLEKEELERLEGEEFKEDLIQTKRSGERNFFLNPSQVSAPSIQKKMETENEESNNAQSLKLVGIPKRPVSTSEISVQREIKREIPKRAVIRQSAPSGMIQRLAAHAERIIGIARDSRRSEADRGVDVVMSIIRQYFPQDISVVRQVRYRADLRGLEVGECRPRPCRAGSATTGVIFVGHDFLSSTTRSHFARRVQQVRHELDHILQWRRGLVGDEWRDDREFLAYARGVLEFSPPAGTGQVDLRILVRQVDAAMGYYFCMRDAPRRRISRREMRAYRETYERLLRRRDELVSAAHTAARRQRRSYRPPVVPDQCVRVSG